MSGKIRFNPYEVLGIQKGCTEKEIQNAYRKQCLKWHPDKNLDNQKEAEERFIQAKEAFEFLYNAERRAEYDSGIEQAERREAMQKQRMEKSDSARRRFIDELNQREQEAQARERGQAQVLTPAQQAAREKAMSKKIKADFEELRKQLEKEAEDELRRKENWVTKARNEGIKDIPKDDTVDCAKLKVKWSTENSGDYHESDLKKLFTKYGEISTISTIITTKKGKGKMCVIEFCPTSFPESADSEKGSSPELKAEWIIKPVAPVKSVNLENKKEENQTAASEFSAMSYEELYAQLFNDPVPPEKKARLD